METEEREENVGERMDGEERKGRSSSRNQCDVKSMSKIRSRELELENVRSIGKMQYLSD